MTMYHVLLERAAEKDLARLAAGIHDRIIVAFKNLARKPRPPGCRKLAGAKMTGASEWAITG